MNVVLGWRRWWAVIVARPKGLFVACLDLRGYCCRMLRFLDIYEHKREPTATKGLGNWINATRYAASSTIPAIVIVVLAVCLMDD